MKEITSNNIICCCERESKKTFKCDECEKTFCLNCYGKYEDYESNCCYDFTSQYCFYCYLNELENGLQHIINEITDTLKQELKTLKKLKKLQERKEINYGTVRYF